MYGIEEKVKYTEIESYGVVVTRSAEGEGPETLLGPGYKPAVT
jgi:hypothetical protein